jgi:hypothetical protein
LESNQRTSGSEPDATTNSSCPGKNHHEQAMRNKKPGILRHRVFLACMNGYLAGVNETNEADEVNSPRSRRTIDSVAENGRMK